MEIMITVIHRLAHEQFEKLLDVLKNRPIQPGEAIMKEIDDLIAEVRSTKDAQASVIVAINGIAQRLADALAQNRDLPSLKAAMAEAVTTLRASREEMAAAVVAVPPADQPPAGPPIDQPPPQPNGEPPVQ